MYVLGQLPEGGIAVIGSRTPPNEAAAFAFELARRLGVPIVAGLAPGIDTMAHRGALAAGRPTVAYVAYGFGATDPPEQGELERAIVEHGGAVATLCEPHSPPTSLTLVERDRLQAQHAQAVVLVCSEIDGGAMLTMRFARELGKPRFALSPLTIDERWEGNVQAMADGAAPLPWDIDSALEIVHAASRQ